MLRSLSYVQRSVPAFFVSVLLRFQNIHSRASSKNSPVVSHQIHISKQNFGHAFQEWLNLVSEMFPLLELLSTQVDISDFCFSNISEITIYFRTDIEFFLKNQLSRPDFTYFWSYIVEREVDEM